MPVLGSASVGDGSGGSGLPAGFTDVSSHPSVAGSIIDDCDALGAWTSVSVASAPALSSAQVSTGISSVTCTPWLGGGQFSRDFATGVDATGHSFIAIDVRPVPQGASLTSSVADLFEVAVAAQTGLAGASNGIPCPAGQNAWATVYVPLDGITSIGSIGIRATAGDATGSREQFFVDNIRFPDETELDQALASAPSVAVLVRPDYAPAVPQQPHKLNAKRTVIDTRQAHAHFTGLGGTYHVRDWMVDESGTVDVTNEIQQAFNDLKALNDVDGNVHELRFTPGVSWLVSGNLYVPSNAVLDFQGGNIITDRFRGLTAGDNGPLLLDGGVENTVVRNFHGYGYRTRVTGGAGLTADGGAPISGTLAAQGDALRAPDTGWTKAKTPWYARYPLVMFPDAHRALIATQDSTFRLGNAFVFRLSDSNHVAGDCVIEIVDFFDAGTVYASRTLTLTATPTDYVVTFVPYNLLVPLKVRVRKATSTANTITVDASLGLTEYGYTSYDSNHDQGNFILASDCRHIVVEDFHIEGAATDPVDCAGKVDDVILRRFLMRCSNRQGSSANSFKGDIVFEDGTIMNSGRSGFDCEPYNFDWYAARLTLRHLRIYNSNFQYISCNNWGGISDLNIDDIMAYGHSSGFKGGSRDGKIGNIVSRRSYDYYDGTGLGPDQWGGLNCRFHNIDTDADVSLPPYQQLSEDRISTNTVTITDMIAGPAWQASTAYALDGAIEPTARNGRWYKATTGGTSGTVEPAWPTTAGQTVTDGTAVWTDQGLVAAPPAGTQQTWVAASMPSWLVVGQALFDGSTSSTSHEATQVTAVAGNNLTVTRGMPGSGVPNVETHPLPATFRWLHVYNTDGVTVDGVSGAQVTATAAGAVHVINNTYAGSTP